MSRSTWVYPSHGGEPYLKGERELEHITMVAGDLPDFVSPVDGKAYSGRRGLHEHCVRNDVVPNAELTGLPTLTLGTDIRSERQKRDDAERRKGRIIHEVYSKLRDQL